MFDHIPATLQPNVTGWLVYDNAKPFPDAAFLDEFMDFDDFTLAPADNTTAFPPPQNTVTLDIMMVNLDDGVN
jgi:iron transport multicopper oxidase